MLSNQELIEEFYELNKEKYPHLTIEQFKEVCHAPWKFAKQEMESGYLPEIRFKYFGVFKVKSNRAKFMLSRLKVRFEEKKIEAREYFKYKEMLEKFLKNESI